MASLPAHLSLARIFTRRSDNSSRKSCAVWLLRLNRVQVIQPFAHRLLQVIAGLSEGEVALSDKFLLLMLQIARRARATRGRSAHQFGVHRIDLAIEVGEIGTRADRLFDRTPSGSTIEARLARNRHHRAQPLQLEC